MVLFNDRDVFFLLLRGHSTNTRHLFGTFSLGQPTPHIRMSRIIWMATFVAAFTNNIHCLNIVCIEKMVIFVNSSSKGIIPSRNAFAYYENNENGVIHLIKVSHFRNH